MNTPFIQNAIKFVKRNKDLFVIIFILFVLIPAIGGGKVNIDPKTGQLLSSRAITETSPWSINNGLMDFLFVIPIGKGVIFFDKIFNSPIIALGIVAIIIHLLLWIVNNKSNIDNYKINLIQKDLDTLNRKENEKIASFLNGRKKDELTDEEKTKYSELKNNRDKLFDEKKKELYKKNGIKSHSLFFGTAIQLIVIMAVYYAAQRVQVMYSYSFFDINLSVKLVDGMQKSWQYTFLLVLMIFTQFLSQNLSEMLAMKDNNKNTENNNEKKEPTKAEKLTKQIMRIVNCLMIGFIALVGMQFPTVLTVYWILSSILGMIKTPIERYFLKDIEIIH